MTVSTKKQAKVNRPDPQLLKGIIREYVEEIKALTERVEFFAYIIRELPEDGRLCDPHNHSFAELLETTCYEIHSHAGNVKLVLDELD